MKLTEQQLKIEYSSPAKRACVFTGHRELDDPKLKVRIEKAVRVQIKKGVYTFYNGVAKGFDLLSAECILSLKKEYPFLKLIVCVPYYGQEKGYSKTDQERYRKILKEADETLLLSDKYYKGCLLSRNRFMVEHCEEMIAYLKEPTGGTAYTVRYFKKLYDTEIYFL